MKQTRKKHGAAFKARSAVSGAGVSYETKRRRAEHADDNAAILWAHEAVPHECGLVYVGKRYLGSPMVLRRGRALVWECEPGMALRAIG